MLPSQIARVTDETDLIFLLRRAPLPLRACSSLPFLLCALFPMGAMLAIRVRRFGDPHVMELEELARPEPADHELLVRIEAAGVNPVETYIRAGTYARLPGLPYTPGSDAAGTVEAVGAAVRGHSPGDRVYLSGTRTGAYAEFAICSGDEIHPLPESLSFAQGAAIGIPYATAYRALFQRGAARSGESVLIHGGTGGVGLAAVQLAAVAGLNVIATGGTGAGRRLALDQGAARVYDHGHPSYREDLLGETGGLDLIVEMLANVNLGHDLKLLKPNGRIVVVGCRGPVEINPRDAMSRDCDIRGMILTNLDSDGRAAIYRALAPDFEAGRLRPVAERTLPLREAAQAHAMIMEPGARGKIVLIPAGA